MKTQAVLFTGPGQVAVEEVVLPALHEDEVLIETHYTCISPGTDLRVLRGDDRNNQGWPFISGYSNAGRVIEVGGAVRTLQVGDRVFSTGSQRCSSHRLTWGANLAHVVVRENSVFPVPEGVSLRDASLAKIGAIAFHGMTRSDPRGNETVAVIGLGPIGLLSAIFHAQRGAQVVATDLAEDRLVLGRSFGINCVLAQTSLAESFAGHLPTGADVVVDSTGAPPVLNQALKLARDLPWDDSWQQGSRVLVQGSLAGELAFNYADAFEREINLIVSRDQQPRDITAVLEFMATSSLDLGRIITGVMPYQQAPEAFEKLQQRDARIQTLALSWRATESS